jgi:peptidoglycan/LPS O-acetylase OafA/YrhL
MYYPELDGLRFVAFLLVFIHHQKLFTQIPLLFKIHDYGWIGVDLFFALSAYLFTKLLTQEYFLTGKISFKKFYLRRIFRIWPIYFIIIGLSAASYLIIKNGEFSQEITIRIVGLFSFFDNIMTATKGYNPLPFAGHLWTIAYEEQFYIFIPLVILLLVRSSLKTKIISFLSVFILFTILRHILIINNYSYWAIWTLPITHFESIILGIIIGFGGFDFLLRKIKPMIFVFVGILFFIIVSLLPSINVISNLLHLTYIFVGFSTSMILFSVIHSQTLKNMFSKKLFVFLGKRSYGLYIYHLLGNSVAINLTEYISDIPSSDLWLFIYSLTFTIVASILSYKFIEKPFLILKKRFEVVVSRPI